MFDILGNLTKAVVAVAVTPVTLAVDVLAIPFDAENKGEAFSRTTNMLNAAGDNLTKAVTGDD